MNARLLMWLLAPALALLTACVNDDTADGPVQAVTADIMTFAGNTAPGGGARLTFVPSGDMPAVELLATSPMQGIDPGQRVYVTYAPVDPSASPLASGTVDVTSYAAINQAPVTLLTPEEAAEKGLGPEAGSDPVWVMAVWRSATWLNMRLKLPFSSEPRVFALVCTDGADSPEPVVRLVTRLHEGVDAEATFQRQYYASFDISALWLSPSTRRLTVEIDNSNLTDLRSWTFDKADDGSGDGQESNQ